MLAPFFLPGSHGRLFVQYFRPKDQNSSNQSILFVPPFAEELNKSRRMIALLGQALNQQGLSLLVPDMYGTGDSVGDFCEARWEIWLQDLKDSVKWLQSQGVECVGIVGLRLGCLLALDYLESASSQIDRLVLWQPVTSGNQMLTQFLRLRVAAGLMGRGPQETVADLRARLDAGEILEIAGYELAPELVRAIDQRSIAKMKIPATTEITLFEIRSVADQPISQKIRKILDQWQQGGIQSSAQAVKGDAFWMTQEITEIKELPILTASLLASLRSPTI